MWAQIVIGVWLFWSFITGIHSLISDRELSPAAVSVGVIVQIFVTSFLVYALSAGGFWK
jgi:hypothetical protein